MEKKFTSDEVPLIQLLTQADTGHLQLPDFQRGWVWDDDHIRSLLASISLNFPIGAVMTLQTGNPDVNFLCRPVEGANGADGVEPSLLLLDGQQRMTSLYLSLMSGRPVPTEDVKGKAMERLYYAKIAECIDQEADREEAILSVPGDRVVKAFRGKPGLDISSREKELQHGLFPLGLVLDPSEVMRWQQDFLKIGESADRQLEIWLQFQEALVKPFEHYQVPTIELIASTPKEAVCQVFEKVNTGGVPLTVFELVTATYAAEGFQLREDWDERSRRLGHWEVLSQIDATQFLQAVCLLSTYKRRIEFLETNSDAEKAPAVSCKRREVLRLPLAQYEENAELITEAFERLVPFLHTEHVFSSRDIPYQTQLVPLAAIFAALGREAEGQGSTRLIARWLWSGVFGELYGGSTETRFAMDLPDVVHWVRADGDGRTEPRTVRESQFQSDRLLSMTTRRSAAYKGLQAIQMKQGAKDFRTGHPIDFHSYLDLSIDIHHIFPQRWCKEHRIENRFMNSIVNKTPIDTRTNRSIGGNAPSEYLDVIQKEAKIDPETMDVILQSHEIDPGSLRRDDFEGFFRNRFEGLLGLIESATEKRVNRPDDGSDVPFEIADDDYPSLRETIRKGEGKKLEFKSTGRCNLHTGKKDSDVEYAVLKTIAGFFNGEGGTLLVGVGDRGEMVGIEEDFPHLKKPTKDSWSLWLTDFASKRLGKLAAAEIGIKFEKLDDGTVARIEIPPAGSPVFVKGTEGESETFFVRFPGSTQVMSGKEQLEYIKSRWG